jgi:hypothetical protein
MIHFFTDPYKDELIYSAIARYHYYTGNIDFMDTLEELFGKRSIIPSLEIGSNINRLAKNLGTLYTSDYIIKKHTIFPFYSPFLPKARKIELIEDIKYKDGNGLYARLGILAGSICKKNGIYYCPCCAKNEVEKNGEAFIHREHQLQGVYICPKDGAELKRYSIDKSNTSRIEFIRLDKRLLDFRDIRVINNIHCDKLYKISQNAYYLLQTDLSKVSKEKLLEKYKNLLYERDLTTSSKRIRQRELYDDFISFYGKDFLKLIDSDIDYNDEYNWLRVITRDVKRAVHPIRHLLLINFFNAEIDNFFKGISIEFRPFGESPWPCLNKAAEHYKKTVIKDLKITEDYKTRVAVGTFTCECGFVYSRKGPDKVEADRYKIGRIKSFGKVWEDRLKSYLKEEKYGLRETARLIGCDPRTILRYDALLGVHCFKGADIVSGGKEKSEDNNSLEKYKECILKNIAVNPLLTRTELRKICKKEYTYIYRNDKSWLFDTLPNKTKSVQVNKRIDWDERDVEYLNLIKAKYNELLIRDIPIRITKSNIGKQLRILTALENDLKKLPNTEKYLEEILESVEEFQLRRCKKLIDSKIQDNKEIKLWQIQRHAAIRRDDFEKIKEAILKYIMEKSTRGIYEQGWS